MKRLFLAIPLPEHVIDDISATYQAIPGARWMSDNQLHVTLRFLGETPGNQESTLVEALRSVSVPPFRLLLKGVGYFPPRGDARILWVGIVDEPALARLHTQVENASVRSGYDPDKRKFSPHITVARLGSAHPARVARFLASNNLFSTGPFEVKEFRLYSSHLGKEGAHYSEEATFVLSQLPSS